MEYWSVEQFFRFHLADGKIVTTSKVWLFVSEDAANQAKDAINEKTPKVYRRRHFARIDVERQYGDNIESITRLITSGEYITVNYENSTYRIPGEGEFNFAV